MMLVCTRHKERPVGHTDKQIAVSTFFTMIIFMMRRTPFCRATCNDVACNQSNCTHTIHHSCVILLQIGSRMTPKWLPSTTNNNLFLIKYNVSSG